jgi:hypothetical protein
LSEKKKQNMFVLIPAVKPSFLKFIRSFIHGFIASNQAMMAAPRKTTRNATAPLEGEEGEAAENFHQKSNEPETPSSGLGERRAGGIHDGSADGAREVEVEGDTEGIQGLADDAAEYQGSGEEDTLHTYPVRS